MAGGEDFDEESDDVEPDDDPLPELPELPELPDDELLDEPLFDDEPDSELPDEPLSPLAAALLSVR